MARPRVACSGAMKVSVPTNEPGLSGVSPSPTSTPGSWAKPKSRITARSSRAPSGPQVMKTLSGERSRWTSPASCTAASPARIWSARRSPRAIESGPLTPDDGAQRGALEPLHGEERAAIVEPAPAQHRDDVGVPEPRRVLGLALEAADDAGIAGVPGMEHLDRQRPQAGRRGGVDHPDAALGDGAPETHGAHGAHTVDAVDADGGAHDEVRPLQRRRPGRALLARVEGVGVGLHVEVYREVPDGVSPVQTGQGKPDGCEIQAAFDRDGWRAGGAVQFRTIPPGRERRGGAGGSMGWRGRRAAERSEVRARHARRLEAHEDQAADEPSVTASSCVVGR